MAQVLTIGRLARVAGIAVQTIHYYERCGLIRQPGRTRGGYRQYSDADLQRLLFIRRARELNFTLEQVRALIDLAYGTHDRCGDAYRVTATHLEAIRRKLHELRRIEATLSTLLSACAVGAGSECPILGALGPMTSTVESSDAAHTQAKRHRSEAWP